MRQEQDLYELKFGGPGKDFLPLIFPIHLGRDLIGNWAQAKLVIKAQRPAMLQNIRIRRRDALLRYADFMASDSDVLQHRRSLGLNDEDIEFVEPGAYDHKCNTCGHKLLSKDYVHAPPSEFALGCPFVRHPNANSEGGAWKDSSTGKALGILHWIKLPPAKKLQGDDLVPLLDSELAMIYYQQPALLKVIQDKRAAIYS